MAHDQAEANLAGKWLANEENGSSSNSSGEEEVKVTSNKVAPTQNRVTTTRDRVTATRDWVTVTLARRKIRERSNQPGWMSIWCSRSW
jgi:hypothetical protein